MNRKILLLIGLAIAVLVFKLPATADTFDSKWKSPDAAPVDFTGKKIAALILAKNRAARISAEDLLAEQITARGAQGIAGHTLVTESDLKDRDKVKSLLQAAGVVGAVVMRTVLAGGRQAGPDVWNDPQYRRFMGFSSEPSPEDDKKVPFYVEVMIYSLDQDKLIWAGKSDTKASTVEELINSMVVATAEQLNQEGLVKKK